MISKNSRRVTGSVERLKQGGFTGVKGVDVNGSVLSTDTVLHTKNLDVHLDGSLTLRKPVICISEVPDVVLEGEIISTDLVYYGHLFDKDFTIAIRKDSENNQYLGIFKDGTFSTVRLHWVSWQDYTSYYKTLEPYSSNGFYKLNFLDLKNLSIVNTATSSVITNVFVDIANSTFVRTEAEYPDEHSTDLFYSKLYDYNSYTEPISLFKPRTVSISKSTALSVVFDLNIVTPDVNTIQTSDILSLNANLDLDNPYSIRDTYNTLAPTVKGILAYAPTLTLEKHPVISPESISAVSDSKTVNTSALNDCVIPYTLSETFKIEDITESYSDQMFKVYYTFERDRTGIPYDRLHLTKGSINASFSAYFNLILRIELVYADFTPACTLFACASVGNVNNTAQDIAYDDWEHCIKATNYKTTPYSDYTNLQYFNGMNFEVPLKWKYSADSYGLAKYRNLITSNLESGLVSVYGILNYFTGGVSKDYTEIPRDVHCLDINSTEVSLYTFGVLKSKPWYTYSTNDTPYLIESFGNAKLSVSYPSKSDSKYKFKRYDRQHKIL